jgi:hypothetical protein
MFSKKSLRLVPLFALIAASAAPALAVDRPYDETVDRLVDSACRRLDHFGQEMSSKAKGAKVNREGVEIDISDFMKDWKGDCKLFQERFGAGDMASGNALDFVRKAKATEGFISRHPGFTGADSEWDDVRPAAVGLATAYNIDWDSDPTTWRPVRSSDRTIAETMSRIDSQAKIYGKSLRKAAGAAKVDKAAQKGLESASAKLQAATKSMRSAFDRKQPTSGPVDAFFSALAAVDQGAADLGLEAAAAKAKEPLSGLVRNLATAFGR